MDGPRGDAPAARVEGSGGAHTDTTGRGEDGRLRPARAAASRDVFGVALSEMVGFARRRDSGEQRFPSGQRTMLWVKRNLPSASGAVLERARRYYENSPDGK